MPKVGTTGTDTGVLSKRRYFGEALAGQLPLARVNALRARRFAQAVGEQVKTDAVDVRALAAVGATLRLRQVEARVSARRDLDELATARGGLVRTASQR